MTAMISSYPGISCAPSPSQHNRRDRDICKTDPVSELYLEGEGSSLRMMIDDPAQLFELMVASGMIRHEETNSQDLEQDNLLVGRFLSLDKDWIRDPEILEEIEWFECCEPSYFKTYDMSTGDSHMIGGPVPVLHDAQRHEQQCSLNDLVNPYLCHGVPHQVCGNHTEKVHGVWNMATVRTSDWERDWISFMVFSSVECELKASGPKYAVGISRYGPVWIPRSCIPYLPPIGETFVADIQPVSGSKYPLRVIPGGIN